jgi:hypothetical protein
MHDTFNVKLLPHFWLWFQLRVVKNTLHHQLTSILLFLIPCNKLHVSAHLGHHQAFNVVLTQIQFLLFNCWDPNSFTMFRRTVSMYN